MPNESPQDLDEMIASGQAEGDAVAAQKRLDDAARDRAFEYALLNDLEMMIQIAKASSRAAEKEERVQEEERAAALASADPVESERMRRIVGERRHRRGAVLGLIARPVP